MISFKNKPVKLQYDFHAFARLDEDCGINVFDLKDFKELFSPARIRDLVWAGMLHDHPNLTRAEVSQFVLTLDNMTELMDAGVAAMDEAMPKGRKTKQ